MIPDCSAQQSEEKARNVPIRRFFFLFASRKPHGLPGENFCVGARMQISRVESFALGYTKIYPLGGSYRRIWEIYENEYSARKL